MLEEERTTVLSQDTSNSRMVIPHSREGSTMAHHRDTDSSRSVVAVLMGGLHHHNLRRRRQDRQRRMEWESCST